MQGINDLATPFFEVFLSAYVSVDPERFDVSHLPADVLAAVEADSFWCLTKLLDGIQDHYISQQPGIQRLVKRMGELVKRIDPPLATHFEEQGVEYMQFAFRWMNCLLMREINVKCTIRMWDSYLVSTAERSEWSEWKEEVSSPTRQGEERPESSAIRTERERAASNAAARSD